MNNKKGFTLIELLAVIVILSVILAIATTAVIKSINDSKEKVRFLAAKDITEIAKAYMLKEGITCVSVEKLVDDDYLEQDVTNPKNGENRSDENKLSNQYVFKNDEAKEQEDYKLQDSKYTFNGYEYKIDE